jgi:hypothetical protein
MNTTDKFHWDEAAFKDLLMFLASKESKIWDAVEQFKASKQKPKEWEIECFKYVADNSTFLNRNEDGSFGIYRADMDDLLLGNSHVIHAVRRIKDNEVFCVGDRVKIIASSVSAPITEFRLVDGQLKAWGDDNNTSHSFGGYSINRFDKAKPILFTTEDGVHVYPMQYFHMVDERNWTISERCEADTFCTIEELKYFSSKEKAEEYVLMNKPTLSVSDVCNLITTSQFHNRKHDRADEDYWVVYSSTLIDKLKQLAKSKLKQ